MRYPAHLRDQIRQFRADFNAVTARWVEEGCHSPEEVEAWRVEIRLIVESEGSTDRDVLDVCWVWRKVAEKMMKRGAV